MPPTKESPDVVIALTPVSPGWFACYADDLNPQAYSIYALAAFAIVERRDGETNTRSRIVRPYACSPEGVIDDVEAFSNFVAIIAPGQDPRAVAAQIQESGQPEESKIIFP